VEEHGEYRALVTGAGASGPGLAAGRPLPLSRVAAACLAALAMLTAVPAEACRLALALGLDVSSSVDAREYRLQAEGLARALEAPEVREAFLAVPGAPVKLMIYEWSGWQQQELRQDWVTVAGPGELAAVAARIRGQRRSYAQYPTALGLALMYGARRLQDRGECRQRTLDVSGDGTNNDGAAPEIVKRQFPMDGITINGLVVGANMVTLARYYRQFVIQGPGAFVEQVGDYADYEAAMRRKLLRELGVIEMSGGGPE
jgi:Protein of unknown function (DUF1194)